LKAYPPICLFETLFPWINVPLNGAKYFISHAVQKQYNIKGSRGSFANILLKYFYASHAKLLHFDGAESGMRCGFNFDGSGSAL
jgi:hypothetical protein